jgi:hypothetical protein
VDGNQGGNQEREPKFQDQVPSLGLVVRWRNFAAEFHHLKDPVYFVFLCKDQYRVQRQPAGCDARASNSESSKVLLNVHDEEFKYVYKNTRILAYMKQCLDPTHL